MDYNRTLRTQRFGRGSVIVKSQTSEPLSLDQIEREAPSVFASEAHSSRSARYTYIPTRDVLAGLWNEGFRPFEVRQGGSADQDKREHTKHLVRFRQVGENGMVAVGGDQVHPELILVNAHDGTSAYRLFSGLMRMVCTNGLMAGEIFEDVRIKHAGDIISQVIEGAYQVVKSFPAVTASASEMSTITLTRDEQGAFAAAAAELRWEPEENGNGTNPIPPSALLTVHRNADSRPDLWRTLNVVQENVLNGGQRYNQVDERSRIVARRRVRPVQGIDQNRQLNRALWTLAEEMRRLKTAA